MINTSRHAFLVTALCIGVSRAASAQVPVGASDINRSPRFGLLAGVSSTTFGGRDRTLFGVPPDRRSGLALGLFGVLPVAGPGLAVRPELLYSMKGASSPVSNGSIGVRLNYIEVPVLLQLTPETGAALRTRFYAGPSVAIRSGCSLDLATAGTVASVPCSGNAQDINLGARTVDVSGVVGAEVGRAFGALGERSVGVGARYTYGITNASRFASLRNRALSFYLSLDVSTRGRPH